MSRLESYGERFAALVRACSATSMTADGKAAAREAMRGLKDDLDREYRSLVINGRRGTLTQAEQNFYLPVVERMLAGIRVGADADPTSKLWRDDIAGAALMIQAMLTRLAH